MLYSGRNALNMAQDSVVSIATHYGLDSMGME